MPKKSVFAQISACAVLSRDLLPSPRHWNPGLLKYRGKLWLGYRYHRAETKDARCSIAMCEINPDTAEPIGKSQRLPLSDPTNTGHQEDCRFFTFRGEPYVSYTDMVGYVPGDPYTCVVKYARLKLTGTRWSVVEEWQPRYGHNSGFSKEKNWVFFEYEKELFCIYATDPEHVVLLMEGDRVVKEFRTPGPLWQWGHIRGGTPPVDFGDRQMMAIFHSSLPTEIAPHYVRYYAAAYTFDKKPPFRVRQISETPILSGSEEDGHRVDPRYVKGWKPFIPFPCGLIADEGRWLISFGINDWACAVGRLTMPQLKLGSPDGLSFKPRFFKANNSTVPVRYIDIDQHVVFLHWDAASSRRGCAAPVGYMQAAKAREAVEISEHEHVTEIALEEYARAMRVRK